MKNEFEYIVLGLGGIGSAAVYWLSRQVGGDVLGLEQFEIGHVRGGSQDHSRIIRLSYHRPYYVELAKQAYIAWSELEVDADEKLILKTGGLDFTHPQAQIPISDYTESMAAAGVPYEWLDAAEIMARRFSAKLASIPCRPTATSSWEACPINPMSLWLLVPLMLLSFPPYLVKY